MFQGEHWRCILQKWNIVFSLNFDNDVERNSFVTENANPVVTSLPVPDLCHKTIRLYCPPCITTRSHEIVAPIWIDCQSIRPTLVYPGQWLKAESCWWSVRYSCLALVWTQLGTYPFFILDLKWSTRDWAGAWTDLRVACIEPEQQREEENSARFHRILTLQVGNWYTLPIIEQCQP